MFPSTTPSCQDCTLTGGLPRLKLPSIVMSTSGIGRWRERKGGQFASRQHLTSQRRAMLAPVQRWRKEWTTSTTAPSSSVKVLRWVPVDSTEGDETEEAIMSAALNAAGGRDGAQLAGISGLDADTPGAASSSTPGPTAATTPVPQTSRAPHPLSKEQNAESPRAAPIGGEDMEVDTEQKLKEVVNAPEEVAVAALAGLPDGEQQ